MRLSIIIPAHNEEHRIGRMLDAYLPFFSDKFGEQVEFLVVVNGSTDETERVVGEYSGRYACLRSIVEPRAVGKGGALMLGFRAARGELVGFSDADGSTPPDAFHELVERLGDADGIIASRWCKGAVVRPRQPLSRRVASRIFNLLTRIMFGLRLTDTQCGAKLFRRETVQSVLDCLGITRWAFDVDMLFQMRRNGRRVVEIPTQWHDVDGSKVRVVGASLEMFVALTRLRLVHSPLRWIVRLYDRTLGAILHARSAHSDQLVRHSVLLMSGAQASTLFNFVFQMIMLRMLSSSEYGIFAAMVGLFMTFSIPFGALRGTVTHYVALFEKERRRDSIGPLISVFTLDMLGLSALLIGLSLVYGNHVTGYFQMTDYMPLGIATLMMVFSLVYSVFAGALLGVQAFGWSAALPAVWGAVRLLVGIGLVGLGMGGSGALLAQTAAIGTCVIMAMVAVGRLTRHGWPRPVRTRGAYGYMGRYMFAFAGCAVLMNWDVLLAKHYFDPELAGRFSKAAMIGRTIVFLPQPVALAMFTKVVSGGETSLGDRHTLKKALLLVCGLVCVGALACTLWTGTLLRILAGASTPEMVRWVRGMVWALAPVSILLILLNFEMAQRRFMVGVPLLFCAGGYLGAVSLWHERPDDIIVALAVAGVGALLAALFFVRPRQAVA